LLLAAKVRSFAHMPLGISDRNSINRCRQPTARVSHVARQAISNWIEKLHVLHITSVTIHTEGILTLTCTNIRVLLAH